MIGAIAGDIIGSVYEFENTKSTDFELFGERSRFTDDTVLTVAVADHLLSGKDYVDVLKEYGRKYPHSGYGGMFCDWLFSEKRKAYNSYGNGAAMRVSPIGFACNSLSETLEEAARSAEVTHSHYEGIKGAQSTAGMIFLLRDGKSKLEVKEFVEKKFGYNLSRKLEDIRPDYRFDVTCQGSVPEAMIAFLESEDFEDTIRKAVSLGGDSDTIACIAGGFAQAHYKEIPEHIIDEVRERLDPALLEAVDSFEERYDRF